MGRRHRLLLTGLTGGYVASLAPSWRRFVAATRAPARAQAAVLQSVLRDTAESAQGRRLGLHGVESLRDFQDRVPIGSYEDYAEDIERIAGGDPAVLSNHEVRVMERTSGSTGGNKLVPYTQGLLDDFSAATAPWLFSMYAARPALLGTRGYWSLSPVARRPERTSGGLRIGFEDDTEYFGPAARWAIAQMLAVPGSVAHLPDMAAWRTATLEHLLAAEDLGFVSVWSPTFLTRLMEGVDEELQDILPRLPPRRADRIRRGLDAAGRVTGPALWPRLRLISCWTDGHAARFVGEVQARFPGVEVQPKGLLATEGVFSFPLTPLGADRAEPEGAVAALTSHLLKLIDLEHPDRRPIPVHEARRGGRYAPLMSTRGGLLRYHLRDEVRCVGFQAAAPCFRFLGKLDKTSDVCGEKLTAGDAERAIAAAEQQTGVAAGFAMLAPRLDVTPPRYVLYLEAPSGAAEALAAAVERGLQSNHHYRYARDLSQLGALEARVITGGAARYEAALIARGVRAGDIKPTPLDKRELWVEVFGAADDRDG